MQQYYLERLFINEQQDNAQIALLKCSQNFNDSHGDTWSLKLAKSIIKMKTKKAINNNLRIQNQSSELYKKSIHNDINLTKLENRYLVNKRQRLEKIQRRYLTEYQQPTSKEMKRQYPYLQPIKTVDSQERPTLQSGTQVSCKPRCKTVFIHMLKNKSANLNMKQIPLSNQFKIIHNLSGIKVRMMAKKMEESKNMNLSDKEIRLRLDQITSLQSCQKTKEKYQFKINKGSLKEILSKRHKFKSHKENLKVYQ